MQVLKEKDLSVEEHFIVLDFYKDCLLKANNDEEINNLQKMITRKEEHIGKIVVG